MKDFLEKDDIFKVIHHLGSSFFPQQDLTQYVNMIKNYNLKIITFFSNIIQEENLVKLETSFLTDKVIIEFILTKQNIETALIPINKIIGINGEITNDNSTMSLTIRSGDFFLTYNTFNNYDTKNLIKYKISINNSLNK